ncbi:MAG: hypothetical protein AAFU67_15350, partial [Bacteroidota bacterium]
IRNILTGEECSFFNNGRVRLIEQVLFEEKTNEREPIAIVFRNFDLEKGQSWQVYNVSKKTFSEEYGLLEVVGEHTLAFGNPTKKYGILKVNY